MIASEPAPRHRGSELTHFRCPGAQKGDPEQRGRTRHHRLQQPDLKALASQPASRTTGLVTSMQSLPLERDLGHENQARATRDLGKIRPSLQPSDQTSQVGALCSIKGVKLVDDEIPERLGFVIWIFHKLVCSLADKIFHLTIATAVSTIERLRGAHGLQRVDRWNAGSS